MVPSCQAAAVALLLVAAPLYAQGRVELPRFSESVQAQSRLEELEKRVALGEVHALPWLAACFPQSPLDVLGAAAAQQKLDVVVWDEALAECQRLVQDFGEGLVALEDGSLISVLPSPLMSVRKRVELLIGGFPASVREKRRLTVDKASKALLAQALAERSERPLRRLLEETPHSAASPEALELLGDHAFFRGDLSEAVGWWRRLMPFPSEVDEDSAAAEHAPDPIARVRAKLVLALAYLGDFGAAEAERDAFHKLHGAEVGVFAGKKGPYLQTLDELVARFQKSGSVVVQADWPTLGGSAGRGAVIGECPPERLWLEGATWRVPLPTMPKKIKGDDEPFFTGPSRAAYHPLVLGRHVVLTDNQSVTAFDLATGKQVFRKVWAEAAATLPSAEAPAFTASGAGDVVVCRLGQVPDRPSHLKKPQEGTWLAAVDLRPGLETGKRVRWMASVPLEDKTNGFFAGPPLLHHGRVWAAYHEWQGPRLFIGIGSLSLETGQWLTSGTLCEAPRLSPGREGRRQPIVLSAAGPVIVCATQAGAVVGVDASSGKPVWALRYPSQGPWNRLGTPSTRDLAAPVCSLGRVYVAPQDCDFLFCLDPFTGRVVWEREVLDVVHLFGCAAGKLVFTTATGLRTLAAATGSEREAWLVPDDGRLGTKGRGMILGAWVFWPTSDREFGMRGLSVAQGRPERDRRARDVRGPLFLTPASLRHLSAGNMAYGRGSLVIAGEEELMGFMAFKEN